MNYAKSLSFLYRQSLLEGVWQSKCQQAICCINFCKPQKYSFMEKRYGNVSFKLKCFPHCCSSSFFVFTFSNGLLACTVTRNCFLNYLVWQYGSLVRMTYLWHLWHTYNSNKNNLCSCMLFLCYFVDIHRLRSQELNEFGGRTY